ncbi:MAG: ribosome-associated translation inhibitor RaiA [Proteiniphilum sp.]|nr:ribosome-associated translation inhibitor RaiA [Proteiniphilum sp.]
MLNSEFPDAFTYHYAKIQFIDTMAHILLMEANMDIEIKSIHFSLIDDERDYIDKKIARIRNAENMIVNLIITITKDNNTFVADVTVTFKWGVSAHLKEQDFDFSSTIDRMIDKLEAKITKEKEKHQDKR